MSKLNNFAIDVSQGLPDSDMHGNGDIVTIIELLIPVFLPLIERCIDNNNMSGTFGAGCCELAKQAQTNPLKRIPFRWHLRREMGWSDYRAVGGNQFAQAFIDQAAKSDAATLDAIHAECC